MSRSRGAEMGSRRVLVTNDDGPAADGLAALVRAATRGASRDIVVATPTGERSGTGTALGVLSALPVPARRARPRWPGVLEAYEVSSYPSAIVTLAMMGAFGPAPDLVLVGVNHGVNVGRGLIHSSTVGAALTAAAYHAPAAAFSADTMGMAGGTSWARWHATLVGLIDALSEHRPQDGVLSVNLPAVNSVDPCGHGAEPVWCRVAETTAVGHLALDLVGRKEFSCELTYGPLDEPPPADTDAGALARGRVALTWLALPYPGPGDLSRPVHVGRRQEPAT